MTIESEGDAAKSEMREIMKGAAMYTSASILGPLILFSGIGMLLDWHFDKSPIFLLVGVGVAFIVTNIFLFRRAREMTAQMNEYSKEIKDGKKDTKV